MKWLVALLLAGCATTNPGFGAPYEGKPGETCAMWHQQDPGGYCEVIVCRPLGQLAYIQQDTCSSSWWLRGGDETL